MQDFVEFQLDDEACSIILTTSTEDLYYLQDDIYDYLSQRKGERFIVIIDLFLRNGFSFNRFISLQFNGKEQCKSFIVNPREISEEVKCITRNYLKTHTNLLESSSLSQKAIGYVIEN